jgi:hypothetical protein
VQLAIVREQLAPRGIYKDRHPESQTGLEIAFIGLPTKRHDLQIGAIHEHFGVHPLLKTVIEQF